jgi:hypothetical protein
MQEVQAFSAYRFRRFGPPRPPILSTQTAVRETAATNGRRFGGN